MPPNPELETRDDSIHHDALRLIAQHLQTQMGGPPVDAAGAAQRMSQLVEQVRGGVLGVPTALLGTLRAAGI
jgi:hypothetical protein